MKSHRNNQKERRGTARVRTIGRPAHIIHGRFTSACRVVDISNSGLKLETEAALSRDDAIKVEFSPEEAVTARVIWREGSTYGAKFLEEIDCYALLRRLALAHWQQKAAEQIAPPQPDRDVLVREDDRQPTFRRGLRVAVQGRDGALYSGTLQMSQGKQPVVVIDDGRGAELREGSERVTSR